MTVGGATEECAIQMAAAYLRVRSPTRSIFNPAPYPIPVLVTLSENPSKPCAYDFALY